MKTTYNQPDDWVYASVAKNGTQPYWPNSIFRVYTKPAAKKFAVIGVTISGDDADKTLPH